MRERHTEYEVKDYDGVIWVADAKIGGYVKSIKVLP